ncbi:phage tail tape measure protein [Leuconostoc citreum]|uniref:phage tail tape measure protein n=1 Tax=Leuconostoc citreum TaxID=33964 RepID=UPI0021A7373F|nr:phage tail tape measure protein [Leuconostoc citreum]
MANYSGGNVTAHIGADISDYQSAMRAVSGSTQSAMATSQKVMSGVGKTMMGVGAATTAMGITSVKSFGSFQASLNQAAVIAGGTSKDIKGLSDVANKMGADLPLSAKDAADAMVAMARDGASINTIKSEFPAIAQAATAAGADLQTTASVVQQSMNIWGDSIKSPQRAAAVLTQTANLSNASIEDMQQALATIGGTANNAGIDMQTTSTAIGLLTNRGFSAAQASQDLNHALLLMQAPSKMGAARMQDLGLSMTDAQGNMKPLPQILNEIGDATANMSSSDKAAALKTMFGSAGMAAILPLMKSVKDTTNNTTTSWTAFTNEMNKASSSTQTATDFLKKQANEMQQNLGSKIEQVGGNWESLRNKAMSGSSGVTGSFLNMVNGSLNWATESNNHFAQVTRQFLGLAPAIGPVITATGGFITNFGKITGLLTGVGKTLLSAGKGLVSFGLKMVGIATGNTAVATSSVPAAAGTKAVGSAAKTSAKSMIAMGLAILEMGAGISLATGGVALLVMSITQLAKTGMSGIAALAAVTVAVAALVAVFALAGPLLTAGAVGIGVFGAAVFGIGVGIGTATAGIALMIDAFVKLTGVTDKIIPTFQAAALGIVVFVTTVLANVPIMATVFVGAIISIVTAVANGVPQIAQQFVNMILGIMSVITQNIPLIIGQFTDMVISIFDSIGNNAPRIVASFAAMLGKLAKSILEITPYVFQLTGALIAGMITVIATYNSAFQAIGGIVLKSLIAGITGKKFDAMGAAADVLNSAGKSASQNGMSAFDRAGGNSAISALNAIGRRRGDARNAGSELGGNAADGVNSQQGNAYSSGTNIGQSVSSGVGTADLRSQGEGIMGGFLGGLQGTNWGRVMGFVGSVAGWIASHKGPISYDRKLLIPAGQAIMSGFGNSLNTNFETVKKSVSSYAGQIADEFGQQQYTANAQLTTSSTGVAGQINGGLSSLSEQVAEQQAQAPIFQVFNEMVGDKITTTVNSKNARRQATVKIMGGGV